MTKRHRETIEEVIVVEGIHDKQAIDCAVIADCILTQGSTLSEETLKMIARAQKTRGVIVFTDPDYVGERLRKIIDQRIPGCKHAFLTQKKATKDGDIGIENATPEAICEALANIRSSSKEYQEIPWKFMLASGLAGGDDSKERRLAVAEQLQIGYANAKQFWNRLNALRIPEDEVIQALIRANLIEEINND
ncbi:ribonuclease M5 [Desulfuribacillus stibiiarsenatis]|nr:ribonuclease M5 [Desulfuribacillus stibiiarsenatis]